MSSSSSSSDKYDVFLSFRGEDTRKNFTDHLHAALKRKGILTFRDDPKLDPGKEIEPELIKAIQESWCSLIVFSQTYAFSRWCLDELAEIVQQKKEREHKVFPIFYDVDPTHIRKQTGKVKEAFAEHEERYKEDKDKTQRWRSALTEVANLKGWHLQESHESDFIDDIVKDISIKLCVRDLDVPDDLVGIESRLEKLLLKVDIEKDDVRIVGICGMGGIGKTRLASIVYTQLSSNFDGRCFLADVREVSEKHGLVSLQKQLLSQILLEEGFHFFIVDEGKAIIRRRLSHKKVLIVIDDVDNLQHLKCLVGRPDWFGSGSRIIVTTRDEQLLRSHRVHDVYEPTTLNDNEALHFFNMKAFGSDTVTETHFIPLSKHVVKYAGGLPLALEVLGCHLCGRGVELWRSAIERLERDSNKEILDRLQIGFDELEETEKNIFLDIACFFDNGEEKDLVIKVLDGCDFSALIGIDVLIKKSLIKDCGNYFWMHDLLREMGRKIVGQKSLEPGEFCRLWKAKDVYHVLTNNTATKAIESMVISFCRQQFEMLTLTADAFLKMKRLRLLKIFNQTNVDDLNYISNELRLLDWSGYPLTCLPTSFQPDNLVALLLSYSRTEQLWEGKRPLYKLRLINLKGSVNLIKTPDLTMAPNLERLILEGCTRISDVHPSIIDLRQLRLLNLKGCKSLRCLPTNKIGIGSLEKLVLSGCSNLQRFPEIDGKMERLLELYLDETGIEELPSSIGDLIGLKLLDLRDCKNLFSLPSSICGCKCLKSLNLSGCSKVETFPENLQQVEFLKKLDFSETAITKLPSFIFQFKHLDSLSLRGCKGSSSALKLSPLSGLSSLRKLNLSDCNLGEDDIASGLCCLSSLEELDLSDNNFLSLPASLGRLANLCYLYLIDCRKLKSLPEPVIASLEYLNIDGCTSIEVVEDPTAVYKTSLRRFQEIVRGINCYKLVEKSNALTLLKKGLKVPENVKKGIDILVPGCEIPEWFGHHTDETCIVDDACGGKKSAISVKIPLPPITGNNSPWVGVALCCLVVSDCRDDDDEKYIDDDGPWEDIKSIYMDIHISGGHVTGGGTILTGKYGEHQLKKDHLWLRYYSRNELYRNLRKPDGEPQCEEVFEFRAYNKKYVKVKKCGVRFVYEEDLEDQIVEEIKRQRSSPASATFNDYELAGNDGVFVKGKRDIYENSIE
ncbi:hypothetical protein PTKIN_Ptkin14bG0135000 [Pterospermum kingtungense]